MMLKCFGAVLLQPYLKKAAISVLGKGGGQGKSRYTPLLKCVYTYTQKAPFESKGNVN